MKQQLHPGVRWVFRMQIYLTFLPIFFFFFVLSMFLAVGSLQIATLIGALLNSLFWLVIFIILGEVYARMSYNRWFYEFTSNGVKLERGIIWKKYSNIPYERIQNIDVHRGILARIFGFSEVNIQTAGYSNPMYRFQIRFGGFRRSNLQMSEGYIPAVDINEAEKIREFLLKKISD